MKARQKFVVFEFLYKIYRSEVSTCDWNINANAKQKNLQHHNALQIQWKQSLAVVELSKFYESFQNA